MNSIGLLSGLTKIVSNVQFLLVAGTNLCLFLVISAWSFLPLFIVELGGNSADAGLVMGSLGLTSLGSIPFLTPLMDRYGRKVFIISGILLTGVSNGGFLLFESYSPLMILVRLIQGVGFAACFNGCATAVVDLVPPEHRAQGIGLFGVSSSLAFSFGPYLAETILLQWGFVAFFMLLIGFGIAGVSFSLFITESDHKTGSGGLREFFPTVIRGLREFFPTVIREHYFPMMAIAIVIGSGFAAMNVFFPLHAKTLALRAGPFFTFYGISLLAVRVLLGEIADRYPRERLIFLSLVGFGLLLLFTALMTAFWHTILLGTFFGVLQGISYPAMMARMVDRSREDNRAVVVGLFTGSFGLGINASVLLWGFLANLNGLPFMYMTAAATLFGAAALYLVPKSKGSDAAT